MIINPVERRSYHAKIYLESTLAEAIKEFKIKEGCYSFSEAGRKLMIDGLRFNGMLD